MSSHFGEWQVPVGWWRITVCAVCVYFHASPVGASSCAHREQRARGCAQCESIRSVAPLSSPLPGSILFVQSTTERSRGNPRGRAHLAHQPPHPTPVKPYCKFASALLIVGLSEADVTNQHRGRRIKDRAQPLLEQRAPAVFPLASERTRVAVKIEIKLKICIKMCVKQRT